MTPVNAPVCTSCTLLLPSGGLVCLEMQCLTNAVVMSLGLEAKGQPPVTSSRKANPLHSSSGDYEQ